MTAEVLTISSKGQISIPVEFRNKLEIGQGDKLIAYVYGDSIMLKVLKLPTSEEFEKSMDEAEKWASSVGYKEEDVEGIVKSVRLQNKNEDSNRH